MLRRARRIASSGRLSMAMPQVYTAASVFVRMAAGLIVFAMLARGLGVRDFGIVALIMAYSALASLVGEFGLTMKSLRDIAHEPEKGGETLAMALRIKLVISLLTLALAALITLFFDVPMMERIAWCMLCAGVMIASIGDVALAAFRATGRFLGEFVVTGLSSILYCGLVIPAAFAGQGILPVAAAFMVSRVIHALVCSIIAGRLLPAPAKRDLDLGSMFRTLKAASPWAAFTNLAMYNAQIDGFILAHFLGPQANGIYQSGARFALSAITFATVIVNTQVPRISAAAAQGRNTLRLEAPAWLQMAAIGAFFGLGFLICGPFVTHFLLGPQFVEVDALWAGFAVLTFCRFLNSAMVVSFAGLGKAKVIAFGELACAIVATIALPMAIPALGLHAVAWVMCAASLTGGRSHDGHPTAHEHRFGRPASRHRGKGGQLSAADDAPRHRLRLGFDAHVLDGRFQGSRTAIERTCRALADRGDVDVVLFSSQEPEMTRQDRTGRLAHVPIPEQGALGRLWSFRRLMKSARIDVALFQYISPPFLKRAIVVIHDILPITHPRLFPLLFRVRSAILFTLSMLFSWRIMVPSNYTRDEIARVFPFLARRVIVGRNGPSFEIEHYFGEGAVGPDMPVVPGRYILAVGRIERRKNMQLLVDAFEKACLDDVSLVIVGKLDMGCPPLTHGGRSVLQMDHVSNAELVSLYRRASLFVYPSQAEGFGLPLLDATLFGLPVLSSNLTAMPEVGGDLAHYFDPTAPDACDGLAARIADHFRGTAIPRPSLADRRAQAERFSWAAVANCLVEATAHPAGGADECL